MSVGTAEGQRGRSRRSVVGIGLAGVLLMFAVLATLQAVTIHPFHAPDEISHIGYALTVSRGDLPTIESPIPGYEFAELQHRVNNSKRPNRTIWTANHPPLYYLVVAVPLRLGVDLGHPLGGIRVARLVNVVISMAGLALTLLLARELLPARPELWVAAAGLAALVPALVLTTALVYNDSLMFTLAAASLLLVARVLRRGPTPRRVALLALLAAASALTRATGLIVVAVAAAAVVAAVWLHDSRPAWVKVLRAVAAGGAVALTAVAVAGWFYVRNRGLYDGVTGTGALLQKFSRQPRGTIPEAAIDSRFWYGQLRRLWDDSSGPTGRNGVSKYWLLTFVPVLGLALAGVRWLRRPLPPRAPLLLAWLACLGMAVLVELSAISFYSRGGSAHGRYLLAALAVLAVAAAAGMAGFPGPRALPIIGTLLVLVVVNVIVWQRFLRANMRPDIEENIILTGLRSGHVTAWILLPAAMLLCAGLAAQVWALWTLAGRRAAPVPVSTAPNSRLEYAGS